MSSVVERQSCKLKVLGSVPSGGFFEKQAFWIARRGDVCPIAAAQDSLAERSKAVAQGATPQGRGLDPRSCHFAVASNSEQKDEQKYAWRPLREKPTTPLSGCLV